MKIKFVNSKEIDCVALNETKDILFAECKWKDNVDAVYLKGLGCQR